MHSGGDFVHVFVLEIIEISVERHENKLSRLFEAEVWKSMRLCALGRIFSVFYPYGFVHGVSVFHADVEWACGKHQLLSGAVVDIAARVLWNGGRDRGQGESVRDAVLVSDDTAVSDVICGVQGGEASYWSPVFVADGKEMLNGSYYVFFCYSMVSIVLFLKEYVSDDKKHISAAEKAVGFSGGVFAALYLILIGLFGVEALAQMKFPAVTMMSRVQVTGGF